MSYVPINLQVFTAAYTGAMCGMTQAKRAPQSSVASDYAMQAAIALIWAEEFDTLYNSAATADAVQVEMAYQGSYGVWEERGINSILASQIASVAGGIVASIAAAEAAFAGQGITPPTWGGGGGGGNTLPNITAIGQTLISTGTGAPSPANCAWDIPGGLVISSFTGFGGLVEVGNSVTNPTVNATYNETPQSANVTWTNPSGGPLALTTPFTSIVIPATFTSAVINTTSTVTLHAVGATNSPTATQTRQWGGSIVAGSVSPGSETPGQTLYNALRASLLQIHTSSSGSYAFTSAAGLDQVFGSPFGIPGTIKDQNGFVYVPTNLGTATITENGTSQLFTFFRVGVAGSTVTFTLS